MAIELYAWGTPNGRKISVALEEMGLPYNSHPINIGKGEQFKPEFLKISPNNRIPAIVDPDGPGGKPYSLFESGAILIYLSDKTKKFLPSDPVQHYDTPAEKAAAEAEVKILNQNLVAALPGLAAARTNRPNDARRDGPGVRRRSQSRLLANEGKHGLHQLQVGRIEPASARSEYGTAAGIVHEFQGFVALPQTSSDDEMILKVLAHPGKVQKHRDAVARQLRSITDA